MNITLSKQEIKLIIDTVVDYDWPIQIGFEDDSSGEMTIVWTPVGYGNLEPVVSVIYDIFTGELIRLDPDHLHDWAIETRKGKPVWAKIETYGPNPLDRHGDDVKTSEFWKRFATIDEARWSAGGNMYGTHRMTFVASHPLKPDELPPKDWTPERKRILS